MAEHAKRRDELKHTPCHIREQSLKTVLIRAPLKGSSLADIKPLERVVLTPAGPPMCRSPRLPKKSPIRKGDVSTEK